MTAASTCLPRKSDAEFFNRFRCLVATSETDTMLSFSSSVSCIEKAMFESCSIGWADAWHGDGSIDLKLKFG